MNKTVKGLYFQPDSITIVSADRQSGAFLDISRVILDPTVPPEERVILGLKHLKSTNMIKRSDFLSFSYQTEQMIYFQTKFDSSVDEHEMLSWELTNRTDRNPSDFSFAIIPIDTDRAVGIAYPHIETDVYIKALKKVGFKASSLSPDFTAIVNLCEHAHGSTKDTIIFHAASPVSTAICIKEGRLWDVRMMYEIDPLISPADYSAILKQTMDELQQTWDIPNGILTKITGSMISDKTFKAELLRSMPNCYELNCLENCINETGLSDSELEEFNSYIAVAAGLTIVGGDA